MLDGKSILPFASSQDHKTIFDGDQGPNTGGMGAYSPAPILTPALEQRILQEVMQPTLAGMAAEGYPYTGFLYAGIMVDASGTPRVLEFNCRFGDPETQPIMMRLKSDLVAACLTALDQKLDTITLEFTAEVAVGVVMAAARYPESPQKGDVIQGLDQPPLAHCKIFHAGTQVQDQSIVTSGGRVLCMTALGSSVAQAQQRAYAQVKTVQWPGAQYRTDIGYRAIARETHKLQ